jgi:hypothetical protein
MLNGDFHSVFAAEVFGQLFREIYGSMLATRASE